jgi:hypothetical protein
MKNPDDDWPWPNIEPLADLKFDEMIELIVGSKLTDAEKSKLRLAFLTFANYLSYFNAQAQVDKLAELLRKNVWQFRLRGPKAPPRLRWEQADGRDPDEPPGPRW